MRHPAPSRNAGGWQITRSTKKVPFFDPNSLTVNATRFLKNLSDVLNEFCDELKTAEWDSKDWKNVVKKMDAICDNCRRPWK